MRERGEVKFSSRHHQRRPQPEPPMPAVTNRSPQPADYPKFYAGYIAALEGAEPIAALVAQESELLGLVSGLDETAAGYRYAPGKWSIRDVLGHLADTERIMAYRLLRIARGDRTPLPGFDENQFAEAAGADRRTLAELIAEYRTVRAATLALARGLTEEALDNRGTSNEAPMTARALLYIIPGHERHHLRILRERYGLG